MPRFRVTIRYGEPRQRYEVLDIDAEDVAEALQHLVASFPAEARATSDLVEVRRQTAPDERAYTPE
ncbi:MAG: hypothetical protein P8Z36_06300 [Gemmatimonadota bacterium]|jgi:hypothetical protein